LCLTCRDNWFFAFVKQGTGHVRPAEDFVAHNSIGLLYAFKNC
jgi:hypothetical protein